MTYKQLIRIFELNPRIMLDATNASEFDRHCKRIMRHPADLVLKSIQDAVKIYGNDKPRLYYIKAVHDILLSLEKQSFNKPVAQNVKEVLKGMFG